MNIFAAPKKKKKKNNFKNGLNRIESLDDIKDLDEPIDTKWYFTKFMRHDRAKAVVYCNGTCLKGLFHPALLQSYCQDYMKYKNEWDVDIADRYLVNNKLVIDAIFTYHIPVALAILEDNICTIFDIYSIDDVKDVANQLKQFLNCKKVYNYGVTNQILQRKASLIK